MVLLQVGNKIQLSQKRGRWAIFLLPILPIDEGALEFTEENLKLRAELGKLSAVYRDGEAVSERKYFFFAIERRTDGTGIDQSGNRRTYRSL
jgi:hypothetical protein